MEGVGEALERMPSTAVSLGVLVCGGILLGFILLTLAGPMLKKGANGAQRIYSLAIQGGLLVLVIVPPLAFGAVYPWGVALIELVALLLCLLWALRIMTRERLRWRAPH